MQHRLALFAATAVLGTVGMLVPASPASATVNLDACAFTGNMYLSLGLGEVILTPANLVNFFFGLTVGICATKTNLSATGHLHGWCGHSTGSGITNNGAEFHFINAGPIAVIVGHLTGLAHFEADPFTGSCLNKGASQFLVTGVALLQGVVLPNCATLLPPIWQCL